MPTGVAAQQQQKALLQIVHELPAGAGSVLEGVGFIDDHEVVLDARQRITMRRLTRERQRRDDQRLARPERLVAPNDLGVGGDGRQREALRELVHPLSDERGWCENQRLAHQAPHPVFLQRQARFDRFAETDLVGQQDASSEVAKHAPGLQPTAAGAVIWPLRLKPGR